MDLKFKQKNRILIVMVTGEIDHHNASTLRRKTENALSEWNGKHIIYDFENVTFMDSSGIGVLIGRYKQLQALGGKIALVCTHDNIRKIISLSGLNKLIPAYDTIAEALSYVERRDKDAV